MIIKNITFTKQKKKEIQKYLFFKVKIVNTHTQSVYVFSDVTDTTENGCGAIGFYVGVINVEMKIQRKYNDGDTIRVNIKPS